MNEPWAAMLRAGVARGPGACYPPAPRRRCAPSTLFRKTKIMADEPSIPDFIDPAAGNGDDGMPQVGILAQYVKDLSFENPNAPAVYQWQGQPQMDVQVNIGVSG